MIRLAPVAAPSWPTPGGARTSRPAWSRLRWSVSSHAWACWLRGPDGLSSTLSGAPSWAAARQGRPEPTHRQSSADRYLVKGASCQLALARVASAPRDSGRCGEWAPQDSMACSSSSLAG